MTNPAPPAVLIFAATDPTGGTGLQADVLTLSSMGCHALSVVTAVTVQDTAGVEEIHSLDPEWVAAQARCVLEDMPVSAFKIGLLGSAEVIAAVAEIVSDYPDIPLVLDPVFAGGRGEELANDDSIAALQELIIPQTTLITPNAYEIRRIAQEMGLEDEEPSFADCATRLIAAGCEYVLVTGTHTSTPQVINTLYSKDGMVRTDTWERLTGNYHGSGCTLAAACAAAIAQGLDVPEAVSEAQEFTWQSLSHGFRLGMGQQLPDRMFWALENDASASG